MLEKNIRLKTHVGNGVYDTLHPETNSKIVRVGDKNLDETLGEVTAQLAQTDETLAEVTTHFSETDETLGEVTAQLAQTETLMSQKVGNGKLATLADLSQEVKTSMTGGSVAVVGLNAVLKDNIVNKQVYPEKTNFMTVVNNLIDHDYTEVAKFLDTTGSAIANGAGWGVTDFIPVLASTAYLTNVSIKYSYYYDINKVKISAIPSGKSFTTPSNCAYVRFSIENVATATKYILQQGTGAITITPDYRVQLPKQKLAQGSVTPTETNFFTSQANVELTFTNKKTIQTADGVLADSGTYKATEPFYAVDAETSYYTNFVAYKYFYNASGTFISVTAKVSGVFTTPLNTVYVRFATELVTDLTEAVFVKSAIPVTYFNANAKLKSQFIPALTLQEDAVGAENIDFMIKNKVSADGFILNSSITLTDGSIGGSASHARTDFIAVDALKNYYISFEHYIGFYNLNKVFIVANAVTAKRGMGVYQIPEGSYYAIIVLTDFTTDKLNAAYVIQSDVALDLDFGTSAAFLPPKMLPGTFISTYNGMKLTTDGDSITEGGMWQPHLISKLGLNLIKNAGVGGSTVAGATGMCSDARVAAIPTDTELLILMGGSNDWAQNKVMGTINSAHDDTTFYGAYQLWLDKLYVRVPSARVIIMIPPFRKDMYANTLGLVLEGYRVAIANVAHKYGYPTINLLDAGINQLNATTYLSDVVHPNPTGGERIAEVIVGRLKQLEPIV